MVAKTVAIRYNIAGDNIKVLKGTRSHKNPDQQIVLLTRIFSFYVDFPSFLKRQPCARWSIRVRERCFCVRDAYLTRFIN